MAGVQFDGSSVDGSSGELTPKEPHIPLKGKSSSGIHVTPPTPDSSKTRQVAETNQKENVQETPPTLQTRPRSFSKTLVRGSKPDLVASDALEKIAPSRQRAVAVAPLQRLLTLLKTNSMSAAHTEQLNKLLKDSGAIVLANIGTTNEERIAFIREVFDHEAETTETTGPFRKSENAPLLYREFAKQQLNLAPIQDWIAANKGKGKSETDFLKLLIETLKKQDLRALSSMNQTLSDGPIQKLRNRQEAENSEAGRVRDADQFVMALCLLRVINPLLATSGDRGMLEISRKVQTLLMLDASGDPKAVDKKSGLAITSEHKVLLKELRELFFNRK